MAEPRKRILLVDDDEQILASLRLALQERGYEVLLARDGAEGLARAERDVPDLIVLDVVMPRRSGLMTLDRLRRNPYRTPRIILVTGNDEPRHREFAESRRADAFFAKPFEIDALLEEIDRLLES
jgi:CheY-like chemotaxis protein